MRERGGRWRGKKRLDHDDKPHETTLTAVLLDEKSHVEREGEREGERGEREREREREKERERERERR